MRHASVIVTPCNGNAEQPRGSANAANRILNMLADMFLLYFMAFVASCKGVRCAYVIWRSCLIIVCSTLGAVIAECMSGIWNISVQ